MNKLSFHVLRVGIAITFIWIGLMIFQDPQGWSSFIQPWAANLMPIPIGQVMIVAAIADISIGLLLLVNFWIWIVSFVSALNIAAVLIVSGITGVTVRDVGLLAASVALMINSLPSSMISRFSEKRF